jgi:hypothetical protein
MRRGESVAISGGYRGMPSLGCAGGAAMTRKDELHKLADALVCAVYSQVDGDGEMGTVEYDKCVHHILQSLQQVEREVWEESRSKALSMVDYADDDYKLKVFADWCRQQQEGL